jgi:hypothetical protein
MDQKTFDKRKTTSGNELYWDISFKYRIYIYPHMDGDDFYIGNYYDFSIYMPNYNVRVYKSCENTDFSTESSLSFQYLTIEDYKRIGLCHFGVYPFDSKLEYNCHKEEFEEIFDLLQKDVKYPHQKDLLYN